MITRFLFKYVKYAETYTNSGGEFTSYLSIMDKTLIDLLIILYDVIDEEKYERLQSAEDLMRIVMIINNECNKELEKLEDQKQDLSCKLLCRTFYNRNHIVAKSKIYCKPYN
ncbi:unnamed protein product [Rhizophagus irregularis]|nr:unnamed protein product [Rhizophagus irregularis]